MLKRTGDSAEPCGRPGVIVLTCDDHGPTRRATLRFFACFHEKDHKTLYLELTQNIFYVSYPFFLSVL